MKPSTSPSPPTFAANYLRLTGYPTFLPSWLSWSLAQREGNTKRQFWRCTFVITPGWLNYVRHKPLLYGFLKRLDVALHGNQPSKNLNLEMTFANSLGISDRFRASNISTNSDDRNSLSSVFLKILLWTYSEIHWFCCHKQTELCVWRTLSVHCSSDCVTLSW